ncbi:MAG: hypothetical protein HUJ73_03350 [Eubacterium sp.]|nr:hypothetical protein [Eubacterium sp.]
MSDDSYNNRPDYGEQDRPLREVELPEAPELSDTSWEDGFPENVGSRRRYAEEDEQDEEEKRRRYEEERKERARVRAERKERRFRRTDKRLSESCVSKFLLFYFALALFLIIIPRSKTSQIEKRDLAAWPELTAEALASGEYTNGITQFYDDTVPFRDFWKNLGTQFMNLLSLNSENTAEIIGNIKKVDEKPAPTEAPVQEAAAETEPEVTEAPKAEVNKNVGYQEIEEGSAENGVLVVKGEDGHWRALQFFGGSDCEVYITNVNAIRAALPESVKVYSMPVPLSSEFYTPNEYKDYTASQEECLNDIVPRLDSTITTVPVIDALWQHVKEDIYLRTDHHMQALGAYYVAEQFAKAADVPFPDLTNYTKESRVGYLGTMYAETQSANLLNDPDTFTWYYPNALSKVDYYSQSFEYQFTSGVFQETDLANSYMMYLNGDGYVTKVRTECKNGRKLLVIKDSYGNAEIPFFTSSFEEIYVIDMRYFERNLPNFVDAMGITDVLITCSIFSVAGENAYSLEYLLTQDMTSVIIDDAPSANGGETSGGDGTGYDTDTVYDNTSGYDDTGIYDEQALYDDTGVYDEQALYDEMLYQENPEVGY